MVDRRSTAIVVPRRLTTICISSLVNAIRTVALKLFSAYHRQPLRCDCCSTVIPCHFLSACDTVTTLVLYFLSVIHRRPEYCGSCSAVEPFSLIFKSSKLLLLLFNSVHFCFHLVTFNLLVSPFCLLLLHYPTHIEI